MEYMSSNIHYPEACVKEKCRRQGDGFFRGG